MKPDQLAALTEIVATIDRRLSGFEKRAINTEAHMAESATATDNIAQSVHRLSELYVSMDRNLEDLKTVIQNYVDAVREQLRQAKQTEEAARGLTSEIRRRLPEVIG